MLLFIATSCLTLCDPMDCNTPGFLVLHYHLEFAQTHVHWVSDSIQPSYALLFPSPPSIFLPSIFPSTWVFPSELALRIRWPKYWSFSFSISPSNEYSGLISFRIDWFDLLAVQETLRSLLQNHNSKRQFFSTQLIQLSHPYITTGKIIALTIQLFVCKMMPLLCSTPSRFVIAFLWMSKHLLIL